MTYHTRAFGLVAALALAPLAAPAATVDIQFQAFGSGSPAGITAALAARDAFMGGSQITRTEDFEGFQACRTATAATCASADSTSPVVSSQVGDFYRLGGDTGSGAAQVAPEDRIVVRNDDPDNAHGRYDVEGGSNWLDSNDHAGIRWEIPGQSGLSDILKIAFFLTDVDDVGSFGFRFEVSEDEIDTVNMMGKPQNNRDDAELQLVTLLFDKPVSLLSIEMTAGTNDGFGMDGVQVASVPLPAAGWLMLAGFGGLAALRRRKQAA